MKRRSIGLALGATLLATTMMLGVSWAGSLTSPGQSLVGLTQEASAEPLASGSWPTDPGGVGGVPPLGLCISDNVIRGGGGGVDAYRVGAVPSAARAEKPPAPATPHEDEFKVTCKGSKAALKNDNVGGGTVTVMTGIAGKGARDDAQQDGFSLGYTGTNKADVANTRWLQFVWREFIVVGHKDEDKMKECPYPIEIKIDGPDGFYRSTLDPKNPNYNTDGSPYYEDGGADNRTDSSITIYDFPGGNLRLLANAFKDGATLIKSRAHFVSYLVRGDKILYSVRVDMEWEFSEIDLRIENLRPTPSFAVSGGDVTDKLDPATKKRLIDQYPKHDYLP